MGSTIQLVPCDGGNHNSWIVGGPNPNWQPVLIDGRIYACHGSHWLVRATWLCLEDLQTGFHFDVLFDVFRKRVEDEGDTSVRLASAMEAIALASL